MAGLLFVRVALGGSLALPPAPTPMPFPLPVNFSFGICGVNPSLMAGCSSKMTLDPKITVRCSTQPGCSADCGSSQLAQAALARFEARLGSSADAPAAGAAQPWAAQQVAPASAGGERYWWQLVSAAPVVPAASTF